MISPNGEVFWSDTSSVQRYVDSTCRLMMEFQVERCSIHHRYFSSRHMHQFIQDALMKSSSSQNLYRLDIEDCSNLDVDGIVELCEALKHTKVTHLSFERTHLGNQGLQALTELLRYRSTQAVAVADETPPPCIEYLDVDGSIFPEHRDDAVNNTDNAIDDEHWKEFISMACQTLNSLDLSNNQLSPDQCYLADLAKEISMQDLERTTNTNMKSCHLVALIVSNNPIGDEGLKLLCEAIQTNRTLMMLACADCNLSTSCCEKYLTSASIMNPSLQRIYMYGNHNDGEDIVTFEDENPPLQAELTYWLKLNMKGRRLLQSPDCRPAFIPYILGRVSNEEPSILFGLFRESLRDLVLTTSRRNTDP